MSKSKLRTMLLLLGACSFGARCSGKTTGNEYYCKNLDKPVKIIRRSKEDERK